MSKPTICISGTLRDWIFSDGIIYGDLYNDQYPDGMFILTSEVLSPISEIKPGAVIQTMNSYYYLDNAHE